MNQKAKCLKCLQIQLRNKLSSTEAGPCFWQISWRHLYDTDGRFHQPSASRCLRTWRYLGFSTRVFPPFIFPGQTKMLLQVALQRSGDGPGNQIPDVSKLTKDPAGFLAVVEACPIAFGQTFLSLLSLSIQIFEPLASGISDHRMLHLWHCSAWLSLGNLMWTLPWVQWSSPKQGSISILPGWEAAAAL